MRNHRRKMVLILAAGIVATLSALTAAGVGRRLWQSRIPRPTLPLEDTGMENFAVEHFDAVHSPIGGDGNEYLIFGNLPVAVPAADPPSDKAAFLGRWEGYSYGPPVKKDWKYVITIQDISAEGGAALLYSGTNLQYPQKIAKVRFRTVPGDYPSIEWQYTEGGRRKIFTLAYQSATGELEGWIRQVPAGDPWGPIRLTREKSFHVYQDYAAYLAGLRIHPEAYRDDFLTRRYGAGFLLYLPEGYEEHPESEWPLIFFLHGSGDRGTNVFLLAKASPLMMIRECGPLPFIIAAPLLKSTGDYFSFPETYMDGALDQVLADYRVDSKRIYATGLSLGGEATYRFAVHRPDTFAAIAPLSAFLGAGVDLEPIKNLPVWAIHGADDAVVPLSVGRRPADALTALGGKVRFTVLEHHDHDVWTDTYLDPEFYAWLLEHARP